MWKVRSVVAMLFGLVTYVLRNLESIFLMAYDPSAHASCLHSIALR